jgi:methylthioribose-1-phosphate isomerase
MKVDGKQVRPIWLDPNTKTVKIIDQRRLPHRFVVTDLKTVSDVIVAIKEMYVRGAPLIGVTGAYGVYLAALNPGSGGSTSIIDACNQIKAARPTAINLEWGVDRVLLKALKKKTPPEIAAAALKEAGIIAEEEAGNCKKIGEHGLTLIKEINPRDAAGPINILTHCNAGWLACVEYGTATAPIYAAVENGMDIHVWVDETRPLNQGARLTAWELGKYGISHTVITDNAGGHLMQHNMVDMVIVGTDRTTYTGDVANKIGTYLKALAAWDNHIPFYVALPSTTFDWTLRDGVAEIPIEMRDPDEVRYVYGAGKDGDCQVLVPPANSPAANFAFDVTPARLVTGFITERGICKATETDILNLFPEKKIKISKRSNG